MGTSLFVKKSAPEIDHGGCPDHVNAHARGRSADPLQEGDEQRGIRTGLAEARAGRNKGHSPVTGTELTS